MNLLWALLTLKWKHRHSWWVTDYQIYVPVGKTSLNSLTHTLITYVCRHDTSHTRQITLQGNQEDTAKVIIDKQKRILEEEQAGRADVPEVFNDAWGEEKAE